MGEIILFGGLAALITMCSILVVTLRNPISALVFLVLDLFLLAGVYAFQGADFVAAIQIIIYTGAILVLFLFVIMILNLDPSHLQSPRGTLLQKGALVLVLSGFAFIGAKLLGLLGEQEPTSRFTLSDNTLDTALTLFRKFVWPFEIASLLILLAIVGSVVVASRKKMDS